tara:strand:+ start:113 stop:619 length:507 start_codon:yes stop_codon:yes gene_type:complete
MQLILWAAGINGEGSCKVALSIIKVLINKYDNKKFKIFISSGSTLSSKLRDENLLINKSINQLPKIYRLYPIQGLFKLLFPINLFCRSLITIDDYPFRNANNQILYFHQANLVFSNKFIWKLKRLFFNSLHSKTLKIFVQTKQMHDLFKNKFTNFRLNEIFFEYHFGF